MVVDQTFFVGQKAFINKDGNVLILNDSIGLDFPGGKIQEGESDFVESLKREVKEETGLEIEVIDPFYTWYFDFGKGHRFAGKRVFLVGYKCKYVSGEVMLSGEHDAYRWIDKQSYKDLNDGSAFFNALKKYFES